MAKMSFSSGRIIQPDERQAMKRSLLRVLSAPLFEIEDKLFNDFDHTPTILIYHGNKPFAVESGDWLVTSQHIYLPRPAIYEGDYGRRPPSLMTRLAILVTIGSLFGLSSDEEILESVGKAFAHVVSDGFEEIFGCLNSEIKSLSSLCFNREGGLAVKVGDNPSWVSVTGHPIQPGDDWVEVNL